MWIYPGQTLLGAGGQVKKGSFHVVTSVDDTGLILENSQKLTKTNVIKSLRLSHCITYASCQGLTLKNRVRLLETDHSGFNIRTLYVGSSRCTSANLLEVS